MTRTEILTRYRRLRQISKELHQAVLDVIAPKVVLDWANNTETDLAGYNVYRSTTSGGPYAKVNPSLVSASKSGAIAPR